VNEPPYISNATELPSLPAYVTTKHFVDRKRQGPLNKMLSKMLMPKFHRLMNNQLKSTKNKHKVHFY
jgi:hypothetical protein